LLVQFCKQEMGNNAEAQRFVRELVRISFICVRAVVKIFAEDVRQRELLLAEESHG
jgi:hypothetical protein